MSDNWIGIIPRDPLFVPSEEAIDRAEAFMAELEPDADEISSEISDTIQFRDCGANLMSIRCPVCRSEIAMEWWSERMGADYWDAEFELQPIDLPCGHEAPSLNELLYDWDQGFSRFILDTMNPINGPLESEQISRLKVILECPIKVIYQHI